MTTISTLIDPHQKLPVSELEFNKIQTKGQIVVYLVEILNNYEEIQEQKI